MGTDTGVAEACRRLLLDTTLQQLKRPQHVVILKDTATVEQALKTLAGHQILSAPVVRAASPGNTPQAQWPSDQGTKDILGFLDISDILSSFLKELDIPSVLQMKMLQRMRLLEDKGMTFATMPISALKVCGGDGEFLHTVMTKVTLKELIMDGLLEPRGRSMHEGRHLSNILHRVAVFDSDGRITNIVSQTDIVRFLARSLERLGGLASMTVAQLGWVGRQVHAVQPDVSAIEAMAVMDTADVSALAVVDANGKIIGNFSVSEMRSIMAEHFGALALPVGEYLALEHGTEFVGYTRLQEEGIVGTTAHKFATDKVSRTRPRTPGEEVGQSLVLVTAETTLAQVLDSICSHRIHRVYVIDAAERPVGVITCTDVLRKLVELTG